MAVLLGEIGEGGGAAGSGRAHGQVVAARVDGSGQGGTDGGEIGDLRVDFGEFRGRALLKASHRCRPVPSLTSSATQVTRSTRTFRQDARNDRRSLTATSSSSPTRLKSSRS